MYMAEEKHYCYICRQEITDQNRSDEHIILNALGGHLHSFSVLCKDCNSRMGETADAKLAEDLSFFTDMLGVKKNRQNEHDQVMTDRDGHEIIVKNGGRSLSLRKPYVSNQETGDGRKVKLTVRNKKELESFLNGMVKRKEMTQEQADEVLTKAMVTQHQPTLETQVTISSEAFPSIIKSAANYYVDKTNDIEAVQPLIPYIEGKGDCRDVLYLQHLKTLPYQEIKGQVTHMIHIEGSEKTGLLYAMMEYYSIYVYIVVFDKDYKGNDVNMTYTYDVVEGKEVERSFSLPLTIKDLEDFKNQPYEQYTSYLPFIQKRADAVMAVWQEKSLKDELHDVIDQAFEKIPENSILDPSKLDIILNDISDFFRRLINRKD